MLRKKGFTLIELLVVISIIALLIGILLPALGAARRTARQMQNGTQVRGIHQGHVLFSQGSNGFYAGVPSSGTGNLTDLAATATVYGYDGDQYVAAGIAQLLNGNFFTTQYCISPGETNAAIASTALNNSIQAVNYSYASLKVSSDTAIDGQRRSEWKDNTNTQAAILGDRVFSQSTEAASTVATAAAGTVLATAQRSIWTSQDADWRGSVVFGDNSAQFLTTSLATTKYGTTLNPNNDNLFIQSDGSSSAANAGLVRN